MPEDFFAMFFGTEHYVEPGVDRAAHPRMRVGWPFGG